MKILRTYVDTHGIPESVRTDQFSGFKGKTMQKCCSDHNIEQKICPVGNRRGCGLVNERYKLSKEVWELCFWMKTLHR